MNMETIKIAHLYYDLMNLYGEHGNVRALTHHLEEHKIRVIVHNLSVEDKINFDEYDLFYIGSGSKESFLIVLEDIIKHKDQIKKAFDDGKFFFVTGNALDLFGKSYTTNEDITVDTLDLLSYEAIETNFRIVGEQVYTYPKLKEEIIGFVNRDSLLKNVQEKKLFQVKEGTGYAPNEQTEGIYKKNFYGTYLLGPIFIRNPYFTEKIMEKILKSKNISYTAFQDEIEIKAFEEYRQNMLHEKNGN